MVCGNVPSLHFGGKTTKGFVIQTKIIYESNNKSFI